MTILEQIETLRKQEQDLILNNFDRKSQMWISDKTLTLCNCSDEDLTDKAKNFSIEEVRESHQELLNDGNGICTAIKTMKVPATEDEAKEFREHVRNFRWNRQMLEEEYLVTSHISMDTSQAKYLMPLVSRRKHPELWVFIGKIEEDGESFSFKQPDKQLVCNCSDDDLMKNILIRQEDKFTKAHYALIVEADRVMHNQHLAKAYAPCIIDSVLSDKVCAHPVVVEEFVLKHRIGNISCKACLTKMPDKIRTASNASKAIMQHVIGETARDIEYCPRFLSLLRDMTIEDYLKAVRANAGDKTVGNKTCYAGLLHSAMSIDTEEILATSQESDARIQITYLTITKKCDTCDFESVKKEELSGYANNEIKAGEELGTSVEA